MGNCMTWRRRWRLVLAGIAVALAALLLPRPPHVIEEADAQARATAMLARYISRTGEPRAHFVAPEASAYADGWQFSWRYRPCSETGALEIFIYRDGHGDYGREPVCRGAQRNRVEMV